MFSFLHKSYSFWCFLIMLALCESMDLTRKANFSGKFSEVYPVVYSNLPEFNQTNVTAFPNCPQDFQVEYLESQQVKVTWKIGRESLKYLKGFGLQVIRNYGISDNPEPANLTVVPLDKTETKFDMVLTIGYGSSEINIFSLPYKSVCHSLVQKTAVMFIRNAKPENSTWMSPMFLFKRQRKRLEMNFTDAPDVHLNYEICLESNENISRCSTIKKPPVTFDNVSENYYSIRVIPLDQKKICCQEENNCTDCGGKISYFMSKDSCTEAHSNLEYVFPIVSGIVIGILVLVSLTLLWKICTLSSQILEKKSLLLMSINDNELHMKAIDTLISCLESADIIVHRLSLPLECEELKWVLSTFDNILLIDSLALAKRQESWAVDEDYLKFLEEENSKNLTKTLFNVIGMSHDPAKEKRFLRCRWRIVPKEAEFKNYPYNSPAFILPDNLQGLIQTIHGTEVNMKLYKDQQSLLEDNILQQVKFLIRHPDWFEKKYGTPIHLENEAEIQCQPTLYPVLNNTDLVSHVSSKMCKMNQVTDKALGLNQVSLSGFDVESV